jgi:hypothetical protein
MGRGRARTHTRARTRATDGHTQTSVLENGQVLARPHCTRQAGSGSGAGTVSLHSVKQQQEAVVEGLGVSGGCVTPTRKAATGCKGKRRAQGYGLELGTNPRGLSSPEPSLRATIRHPQLPTTHAGAGTLTPGGARGAATVAQHPGDALPHRHAWVGAPNKPATVGGNAPRASAAGAPPPRPRPYTPAACSRIVFCARCRMWWAWGARFVGAAKHS